MVADADTVVHVLAVMVEAVNALVANSAMSRVFRSQNLTCRANEALLEILVQLEEAYVGRSLHCTGVLVACSKERGHLEREQHGQQPEAA